MTYKQPRKELFDCQGCGKEMPDVCPKCDRCGDCGHHPSCRLRDLIRHPSSDAETANDSPVERVINKRTQLVPAFGPKHAIKAFDLLVPIGTPCTVRGVKTRTWSHAGYGRRNVPVVFVEAFEEPVPLSALYIEGLVQVPQRELAKQESGLLPKKTRAQATDENQGRLDFGA